MNIYHKHNLPHYYPKGARFFITFRLFGSIPKEKLEEIQANHEKLLASIDKNLPESERFEQIDTAQKRLFVAYDNFLDAVQNDTDYLKQSEVANIVKNAIYYKDGTDYEVLAYCIMSW